MKTTAAKTETAASGNAVLKGAGRLNWAFFTKHNDEWMDVVALLGFVNYIDQRVRTEEARNIYRKLVSQGWKKPTPEDGIPPTERTIKLHIYD